MKLKVMTVDPGLATGVIIGWFIDGQLVHMQPYEMDIEGFYFLLAEHASTLTHILFETFTINAGTGKKTPAPWSLELIGVIKERAWLYDIDIQHQSPAEAHEFEGTPSKQRLYQLWIRGGEGHAKMANLHFILWCARNNLLGALRAREDVPAGQLLFQVPSLISMTARAQEKASA